MNGTVTGIPQCAEPNWPIAVVAGASQTGVLGVRSLRRRGVQAICFDCNPATAGFRSVYGPARLCPDPDSNPDAWLEFMMRLASSIDQKAVLIPSSDKFVSSIAHYSTSLAQCFHLSPAASLQGLLANKRSQYELAAANGMPMPKTRLVESLADLLEFSADTVFPCLIKPLHYREWQRLPTGHPLLGTKVAIAGDICELTRHYRNAVIASSRVIAQEIIQGPDTAKRVYVACYDSRGDRIANAMFRELRCNPIGFGPASVSEPIVDPDVDRVCDQFLHRIGYSGICEIEVKWDTRDGLVKLIEANPRLSGGGDAAPYDGVDLCWIHYLDLIGKTVAHTRPIGRRFRHIVLRADALAAPAYVQAGLISWRDVRESYRGSLAFYDLDCRDWLNSLETIVLATRSFLASVGRSLWKRGRT